MRQKSPGAYKWVMERLMCHGDHHGREGKIQKETSDFHYLESKVTADQSLNAEIKRRTAKCFWKLCYLKVSCRKEGFQSQRSQCIKHGAPQPPRFWQNLGHTKKPHQLCLNLTWGSAGGMGHSTIRYHIKQSDHTWKLGTIYKCLVKPTYCINSCSSGTWVKACSL